jgi:elongation factor 3
VVRESAQYAIDALFAGLKLPALVSGLLSATERYLQSPGSKWQGKVAALALIGKMAEKAVKAEKDQGDVFLKDVMGRELEGLIPVVESGMHDLKAEVRTIRSLYFIWDSDK